MRDFRYAVRVLIARPVFTLVAVLSLALGMGANSAIFGVIDALWFRPLEVPRSGAIVRVFSVTDQNREGFLSYPEYLELRKAASLRDLVAIGGRGATVVDGDRRQLATLNLVSANFFTALGVKPALGRLFSPADEAGGSSDMVVVLGDAFWRRYFGGDPGIVGKQIQIQRVNNVLVTVIGVLPASFREIETGSDRDLWFSRQSWALLGGMRELEAPGNRWFRVMGRLQPGADVRRANDEISAIAQRMEQSWPGSNRGRRASVVSDFRYRMEQAGTNGVALLAIVLLVVAISSVNVANLLLSRAGLRGREMAVRLALGAGRGRLMRQLMTENLLLGSLGLMFGVLLGAWFISILPALLTPPPGFHGTTEFQFDARVLIFTLVISGATVLLFGLAPAWQSTKPQLLPALKGEAAFSAGSRRWPLRNILVVVQVAVSMTLLASAGVLVRSFANTHSSDLGFGRKQLLLVWISARDGKPAMYRDITARFQALPGVRSVAAAVRAPLSLSSNGMFQRVTFPGRTEFAEAPPFEIKYNAVTASFLNTMGTPVLRGRGLEERDETAGVNSVVINESMARRFWPGGEPLGQTIRLGGAAGKLGTVVGVTKNAPINSVGEVPEPYLYVSYWANFEEEVTFMIETEGDATRLAQAARQTLKSVSRSLEPLTITTENELIRFSARRYELTAGLAGALGLLGLLLTAVGLYGVVSYGVVQRAREIGIRMALGADRGDTLRLVLGEVARLGLFGIALGLPLALTATRLFSSLLFGVNAWDPATFVGAGLLLAAVLLAAGFVPVRRAMAVEPLSALRVI